jgi:hypothetical protein
MKWAFDNSTKLIGLVSFALLVVATVHDWAYFLVIGRKFRSIQTTYDYITSAIEWMPAFLLIGIMVTCFAVPAIRLLGPKNEFGFEDQINLHWRKTNNFLRGLSVVLSIGLLFSSLFDAFPVNFSEIIASIALVLLSVGISSKVSERAFFVTTIVIFCCIVFIHGITDGLTAIKGDPDVHKINLNGGGFKQASVLRTFEKGILVWNSPSESVEFIRWDQIDELSHHVRLNTESSGCHLLLWLCKDRVEP